MCWEILNDKNTFTVPRQTRRHHVYVRLLCVNSARFFNLRSLGYMYRALLAVELKQPLRQNASLINLEKVQPNPPCGGGWEAKLYTDDYGPLALITHCTVPVTFFII